MVVGPYNGPLFICLFYDVCLSKDELFKQRVDYIVGELARCQQARKTGYVGAIPKEDSIFRKLAKGEIHTSGFDLNGGWSPLHDA